MAGCRMWCPFNKEAITIILWYATCIFANISIFQSVPDDYSIPSNNAVVSVVAYGSIVALYSILGLFADVFIGRYRLIQFSLWVRWVTVIMSTFISAMLVYYHIAQWIQSLLFLILIIFYTLGISSFQVVAIQFNWH